MYRRACHALLPWIFLFATGCGDAADDGGAADAGTALDAPAYEVAPPVAIADHDASLSSHEARPLADAQTDAVVGPTAICSSGSATVVYQEVAVGQPDFVALKNITSAPIDLEGYTLVLSGINPVEPREHRFGVGVTIAPGQLLYVFEHQKGDQPGDINTGSNIPFYDGPPGATHPNAAVIYNRQGWLLDYLAIGPEAISLPVGASFSPIPWPAGFDAAISSFQRQSTTGSCPDFATADWTIAPLTR